MSYTRIKSSFFNRTKAMLHGIIFNRWLKPTAIDHTRLTIFGQTYWQTGKVKIACPNKTTFINTIFINAILMTLGAKCKIAKNREHVNIANSIAGLSLPVFTMFTA